MTNIKDDKIQNLRKWMVEKGCIIHPNVRIPTDFGGVLGIGTTGPLPHKTLIIAIPSSLMLTTVKCYNDSHLKKLFLSNDDLFDYQASEDAEFNVLCVFLMYHRLHLEDSPWKEYIQALSEPQTAVDWSNFQLKGLNRSMIEEVIHVRRECDKLEQQLITCLISRKEFKQFSEQVLRQTFHFCYRAVMNRSFGYYFDQTCLIPVADLVNHGCEAVDHQLVNVNLQKGTQFQEGYYPRKQKIDCSLLGLENPDKQNLPFRHRFLVENKIVQNNSQLLSQLDRKGINAHLNSWNYERFKEGEKLQNLHFCSEDQAEDNDTDEDFQYQKERQLEYCKKNEEEQMEQFKKHIVTVEKYKDVEKQLKKIDSKNAGNRNKGQTQKRTKESEDKSRNDRIVEEKEEEKSKVKPEKEEKFEFNKMEEKFKENEESSTNKIQKGEQTEQITSKPLQQNTKENDGQNQSDGEEEEREQNPFSSSAAKGVPIQIIDSSSEQEDQDEQQWGMKEGSYFTMSTSSPVPPNSQIFNSYGSRTNRFLLIWYGFTYPDNLYDSVSFRLHVQFGPLRPAREVVLDTYVGGQGLSFRKNEQEMVQDTQVSRQFRIKRSDLSQKLVIFLRLFLMNYYKGEDLYKLFVTFPASVDFELFVFNYYRDIVEALYERYPLDVIKELQAEEKDEQYAGIKHKIRYKIIYLTEQRKLLDVNLKACDNVIAILTKCKQNEGILSKDMYQTIPMQELRVIRKYLIQYEKQTGYILHTQPKQHTDEIKLKEESAKGELKQEKEEMEGQDDWEDEDDEEEGPKKYKKQ